MLTVKWIIDDHEKLYEGATDFYFQPGEAANVSFAQPNKGANITIDCGEVYVMNENGRTVGNYTLKTKEYPYGRMPH